MKSRNQNATSKEGDSYHFANKILEAESVNGCPMIWHLRGRWHVWTGMDYRPATSETIEYRILRFLQDVSPDRISTSRIRRIESLLRIIQHREIQRTPCWLNEADEEAANLFVVRNGMLRVVGGTVAHVPHDPHLFGVWAAEYDYDAGASCSCWLKFLRQLWPNGSPAMMTLQEWCGYCLLPDTSQQKILAIVGPPRSGKSTIARVLTNLIGRNNAASPSIRDLSVQFGLWGLLDKKLAVIPDAMLPRPCPAVEEVLKSVSGEDAVDVHRKGLPPLTGIQLSARIMILANELPTFHDPSRALDSRLIVLRTTRSFLGVEDTTLTSKLIEELPGILNWAIAGLQRLTSRGRFDMSEQEDIDSEALLKALPERDRVRRIVVYYGDRGCAERRRRRR